ncbi:MAG: hypothetical protein MJE68_15290 [Proteobacteria bacterium]|nr:hypothetical protein [Pseudomonadota bacterium]
MSDALQSELGFIVRYPAMVPLFTNRSALHLLHGLEVALWHDATQERGAIPALRVVTQTATQTPHHFLNQLRKCAVLAK